MTAAGAAAGFVGSVARQYISEGKVSYESAARDGIINGIGTLGLSVGGKALGAAGRYLSETKAVERVKGVVLDGLSSSSESLAAINKKIGSSMQGLMEKIKLPEPKLAFETGSSDLSKNTYSSAMEYADKNVMDNFNKVYANREEIQTAVKAAQDSIDDVGESAAKVAGEADFIVDTDGTVIPMENSYKSFNELKKDLGNAPSGYAKHHIVEQNPTNKLHFLPEMLQNKQNIIDIDNTPGEVHRQITGFMNSKPRYLNGEEVRDFVNQKSFGEQFNFGMNMLKRFGDVTWNAEKGWIFKPNK